MKKLFVSTLIVLSVVFSTTSIAMNFAQNDTKIEASGPSGPAPNSGDGIPDGSGNDAPNGPNKGKS
jgi:hypothetical protein